MLLFGRALGPPKGHTPTADTLHRLRCQAVSQSVQPMDQLRAAQPLSRAQRDFLAGCMPGFLRWVERCNTGRHVLALGPSSVAEPQQPPGVHGAPVAAAAAVATSSSAAAAAAEPWSKEFLPLLVGIDVVGYVTPEFALQLSRFPGAFELVSAGSELPTSASYLRLSQPLAASTAQKRTAAVGSVVQALRAEGWIEGWRDELYPVVCSWGDGPLLFIERAAATRFGIKSYGVHVNGYVTLPDGRQEMWVARRSLAKPTWPGKLDNIAAGGQPQGLGCWENVLKECEEEASIPEELAAGAQAVGVCGYTAIQRLGLKRDVLFLYDLELPMDFVPKPQDGEAEGFRRMPVLEVAALVAESEDFKANCNLVILDFLVRHGYLTPDMPGYLQLLRGLRAGECS